MTREDGNYVGVSYDKGEAKSASNLSEYIVTSFK